MTKEEALHIVKTLSALESWAFSTKNPLPDYLYDDLCVAVKKLEAVVLKEKSTAYESGVAHMFGDKR